MYIFLPRPVLSCIRKHCAWHRGKLAPAFIYFLYCPVLKPRGLGSTCWSGRTGRPQGWNSTAGDWVPRSAALPPDMSVPLATQPRGKNSSTKTRSHLRLSPRSTEECLGCLRLLPPHPLHHGTNTTTCLATCVDCCCCCRDEAKENCSFPHTTTTKNN